jgi:hypothetical protein
MKYQILTLPIMGYRLWLWHHSFLGSCSSYDIYTKSRFSKKKHWLKKAICSKENYKTLATSSNFTLKSFTYLLSMFSNFLGYLSMQFSCMCILWSSLTILTKKNLKNTYLLRLVFGGQKLAVSYYLKSFREQLKLL